MQTICLFGSDYSSSAEVHTALRRLLNLPDYYGMNADALNDCLGGLSACPAFWYRPDGPEDVRSALNLAARVFRDNDGDVKEL